MKSKALIILNILISILVNSIFCLLSTSSDYPDKTVFESILPVTVIFIMIWFIYGFTIGRYNNKVHLITSVVFWASSIPLFFINLSHYIYDMPLIGLEYFDTIRNITSNSFGSLLLPMIGLFITVSGFYMGRFCHSHQSS